ncbi:site-specific integrase [Amycolatopsis jiangsuensis]|uniref:Tyr recombinase domain-containing protein n=1 Tax=Amycolatopsis jiangsuensis TaxID=1181879 RepID=A0A840J3X6_9PSEU|nr:hypothetical protein [Amycolatopsis jiangsuensis]MBB4688325.1 hypothetical protein [Amycolatopsis jiangsuensis]
MTGSPAGSSSSSASSGVGIRAETVSVIFRKTAATVLDDAKLSSRQIADQLGHARPSITQDVYMGRTTVSRDNAVALESMWLDLAQENSGGKPGVDLDRDDQSSL